MVAVVDQLTCVKDNTSPGGRGSCLSTNLGCTSTRDQMVEYCCRKSERERLEAQYCWGVLERGFSARLKKMRWCKRSENCRLKSTKTQEIQVNQPGVTMYRTNMPVAAVAKAKRATYHSHTAVAVRRDDYSMARLKVPGFALVRSTGDPAFRFEGSSP